MTDIEQKAREIADESLRKGISSDIMARSACAHIGILTGLAMAAEVAENWSAHCFTPDGVCAALPNFTISGPTIKPILIRWGYSS